MKYGNISSWIWLSLLLLTTIYVTTQATMLDSVTMRKVLPAYAILENADLLNSSRCRTEIDEFRNAVNNQILWGLRGKCNFQNILTNFVRQSYCQSIANKGRKEIYRTKYV